MVDILCPVMKTLNTHNTNMDLNIIFTAWFDLSGLDKSSLANEDEKGLLSSMTSGK